MFVVEALAIPLYCCIVLDASSILTGIPNIYIYIYIYTHFTYPSWFLSIQPCACTPISS
jgi:hypothetical protein